MNGQGGPQIREQMFLDQKMGRKKDPPKINDHTQR
jgi:hypothetical protein